MSHKSKKWSSRRMWLDRPYHLGSTIEFGAPLTNWRMKSGRYFKISRRTYRNAVGIDMKMIKVYRKFGKRYGFVAESILYQKIFG